MAERVQTCPFLTFSSFLILLDRLLHSAPLASPEEFFTPSPTKASQHPLAAVIKRAKQIEASNAEKAKLLAQQQQQQRSTVQMDAAVLRTGKPVRIEVELHPQKNQQMQSAAGSGNRTVIIGSARLHCDPPPNDRARTNNDQGKLNRGDENGERLVKVVGSSRPFFHFVVVVRHGID